MPALAARDATLRQKYFVLDGLTTRRAEPRYAETSSEDAEWKRWAGMVVTQCASFLEFVRAAAVTWEILHEASAQSVAEFGLEAVRQAVKARCDLDPVEAAYNVKDFLPLPKNVPQSAPLPSADVMAREIRAIGEACPLDGLTFAAHQSNRREALNRVTNALRGLRIFLLRHDAELGRRVDAFGELYQLGRVDIPQLAALLNESESDVLALLQERGFARSLESVGLDAAERAAKLRAIRLDRLKRSSNTVLTTFPQYVDRSVIATERIEGIDARAWLINLPRTGAAS